MSRLLSACRNAFGRRPPAVSHITQVASPQLSVIVQRSNNAEPQLRYESGGYHRLFPGELYNQRYQVIRKLGWGAYSTVWLVRDTQNQSLAAMKVLVADMTNIDKKGAWDELGMLTLIREKDPHSQGYNHICQLLDSFTHHGPNGKHICLILEAMHLSVLDVYRALSGPMPLPLLKRVSKHILRSLQYMHEECGVIHTDIKGDNILMSGVPPEEKPPNVELNNDYLMSATFKLSDFGAANMMSNRFAEMIQPESLRSPEVIIGAEWDTKTDIWNFGCIVYEFARGTKLFDPHWDNENSGMNPPQTHLAQMAGLCGAFPPEFLAGGTRSKRYFDDQGHLLLGEGRYSITLEDLLSRAGHSPVDVREIAEFLSLMLTINPKERWPATRLLDHPWLKNIE